MHMLTVSTKLCKRNLQSCILNQWKQLTLNVS